MTEQQIEKIKKEFEEVNRNCDGEYSCGRFPPEVWQFIEQKLREVEKLSVSADILAIVEEKGIVLIRFGDKIYTITKGINITTADLSRMLTDKSNKLEGKDD